MKPSQQPPAWQPAVDPRAILALPLPHPNTTSWRYKSRQCNTTSRIDDIRSRGASPDEHGSLCRSRGNQASALNSCKPSYAIAARLVEDDRGSADWQLFRALGSHKRIGDVQLARGDQAAALDSYGAYAILPDRGRVEQGHR